MIKKTRFIQKIMALALTLISSSISPSIYAKNQSNTFLNTNLSVEDASENTILEVDSESSLKVALIRSKSQEKDVQIVLKKDIILNDSITMDSDVNINLNGFTIRMVNPNAQLIIGKKFLAEKIPYQVYREGHWETKTKSTYTDSYDMGYYNGTYYTYYDPYGSSYYNGYSNLNTNTVKTEYEKVWIPGYYETKFKDVYKWEDDVRVEIRDGSIIQDKAPSGASKTKAYWLKDAHGENGMTAVDMFSLVSGNLTLDNVRVKAADGGDGGNATYSAVWHIPVFGGGDGGRGGDGGNGANIFLTDHGGVAVSKTCILDAGMGGNGGKGGKPNPNYWVFKGKKGKNGHNGRCGTRSGAFARILYF